MKNIAFIIFLLFISICRAQDNNILFQNYNVSNGLSQNTVIWKTVTELCGFARGMG